MEFKETKYVVYRILKDDTYMNVIELVKRDLTLEQARDLIKYSINYMMEDQWVWDQRRHVP